MELYCQEVLMAHSELALSDHANTNESFKL